MDARTRRLEQRWKSEGGVDCHAALLSCLLRLGNFTKNELKLCAYVGHEAARIVCDSDVRPDGIIAYDKYIKNEEIRDFIHGIRNWGINAGQRAVLGVLKKLPRDKELPQQFDIFNAARVLYNIELFVYGKQPREILEKAINQRPYVRQPWYYNMTKEYRAANLIDDTRNHIFRGGSGLDFAQSASFIISDDKVRMGIKSEITRWILDEYA